VGGLSGIMAAGAFFVLLGLGSSAVFPELFTSATSLAIILMKSSLVPAVPLSRGVSAVATLSPASLRVLLSVDSGGVIFFDEVVLFMFLTDKKLELSLVTVNNLFRTF